MRSALKISMIQPLQNLSAEQLDAHKDSITIIILDKVLTKDVSDRGRKR